MYQVRDEVVIEGLGYSCGKTRKTSRLSERQ